MNLTFLFSAGGNLLRICFPGIWSSSTRFIAYMFTSKGQVIYPTYKKIQFKQYHPFTYHIHWDTHTHTHKSHPWKGFDRKTKDKMWRKKKKIVVPIMFQVMSFIIRLWRSQDTFIWMCVYTVYPRWNLNSMLLLLKLKKMFLMFYIVAAAPFLFVFCYECSVF